MLRRVAVPERDARTPRRTSYLLAFEYGLLAAGLPLVFALGWLPLTPIPALWILTAACVGILLVSRDFEWGRPWDARRLGRRLLVAVLPFLVAAPLLLLLTAWIAPERLFSLVREKPRLWVAIVVFYPLLSVYPQGIVYRTFIFHRYRRVFARRWARILASALAFSAAHVIFENWIAPLLALGGGILFAWTYERTRSGFVASVQHALFGCFLFVTGLGWYFYWGVGG